MKTGTIIIIPFPFSELTAVKVRPAVIISTTKDKYSDLIRQQFRLKFLSC
jgi:hypothetical protein